MRYHSEGTAAQRRGYNTCHATGLRLLGNRDGKGVRGANAFTNSPRCSPRRGRSTLQLYGLFTTTCGAGFARFELGAHFLDLRGLLYERTTLPISVVSKLCAGVRTLG